MKLKKLIQEHKLSQENKNAVSYYYKTMKSLIEVAKDLVLNYEKTDNLDQLRKAKWKLGDITDEAGKFEDLIDNIMQEHYENLKQ